MEVVLYEPEIPPNTGNVARLCAAMGIRLNLVEPLGFSLEDKYLKRAGLDYWQHVDVKVHKDWEALLDHADGRRLILSSARRGETCGQFGFETDDMLVLGPETRGLPAKFFEAYPHHVRIPLRHGLRSINMSTAAGILLFEALRVSGGLPE
ncbi:tRNA (cytidine(34)-2'-O)-methyltransferase [Desulfovibrio ferrophilus]|uniref:Putative tRNA (cytidine(34)-2'-O)-methyltransferase n=1 Tax=Desulfovibrio ferrophilus TaxID=241368 RepID=A0A2Z6AVD2_9BACT|nr:tRNA (cytidine(34)-2'-O)-methyltransferase [Desulfovibrio ferrophilus]BBD07194.1 tRNA (cytidine(34)-2'-O)-methyltransferase [Desulfovibrio ferrophilus]